MPRKPTSNGIGAGGFLRTAPGAFSGAWPAPPWLCLRLLFYGRHLALVLDRPRQRTLNFAHGRVKAVLDSVVSPARRQYECREAWACQGSAAARACSYLPGNQSAIKAQYFPNRLKNSHTMKSSSSVHSCLLT